MLLISKAEKFFCPVMLSKLVGSSIGEKVTSYCHLNFAKTDVFDWHIKGIPELVEKFLVTLKLLFCARKQNQNRHRQQNLNSKKNQLSKSTNNKEKENDKKVPMKYKTKQAKASKTIELKLDIDNKSEKVKLL
jgi:hypothetical protein